MLMTDGPLDTPINIGNPGEFSMLELAEIVIRLTSSTSKIVFEPLPRDDPRQRKPDITLAKETLDWAPNVDLEEGIQLTADYFKQELAV
jgi:UDP-glucuronate decarboxylase